MNNYFLTLSIMIQLPHIPFIITIILYFTSSIWSIGYIIKPGVFNKKVAKWTMMMGFFVHSGFIVFLGLESGNIPIIVGYAAFTISFSLSIMYLTQQRQLKHKLFGSLFNKLPSLEGIDKLMWKTISFGFPLLTLGLVFGTFWVKTQSVLGDMWYLDYKVILGLATWLIYAALLHMRLIASFHGTKIACLTIAGFCLVLFTFIGTFFMGSKHAFQNVSEQTNTEILNVQ